MLVFDKQFVGVVFRTGDESKRKIAPFGVGVAFLIVVAVSRRRTRVCPIWNSKCGIKDKSNSSNDKEEHHPIFHPQKRMKFTPPMEGNLLRILKIKKPLNVDWIVGASSDARPYKSEEGYAHN